jgi:hypothetical protein
MSARPTTPLAGDERVRLLEQLAREHRLLRDRVLEMTAFAEEAVARAVLAEKRLRHLEQVVADRDAHIDALLHSRTMRLAAPARRMYAWLRRLLGR